MARCEYNPVKKQPAQNPPAVADCMNEAELSVGQNGLWHICRQCAALPQFNRLRRRVPLKKRQEA